MTEEKKYKGTILLVNDIIELDSIDTYPDSKALIDLGYFVVLHNEAKKALEAVENDLQFDLAIIDLELKRDKALVERIGEDEKIYHSTPEHYVSSEDIIRRIREKYPRKPIIAASVIEYKPSEATIWMDGRVFYHPEKLEKIISDCLNEAKS